MDPKKKDLKQSGKVVNNTGLSKFAIQVMIPKTIAKVKTQNKAIIFHIVVFCKLKVYSSFNR